MDQAPELRIDDARRNQVVSQLEAHMLVGRLTPSEYDERVGLALAAKTESDLRPLLADMPVLRPRWPKVVAIIVACVVVAALIVGIAWSASHRQTTPVPAASPATSTTTTVTPPPQTVTSTAIAPTATTTVVPPTSTVTVTAPPPQVTVTAEPTDDCPFTRPLSPAQLAQAGAACAMGQDAYCHCVP